MDRVFSARSCPALVVAPVDNGPALQSIALTEPQLLHQGRTRPTMSDPASPNLSWRDAVVRVLMEASEPLHYAEITKRILDGNFKEASGATPNSTVNATISSSLTKDGQRSPFRRAGVGVYELRDPQVPPAGDDSDDTAGGPVAAFGIHWRRKLVQWTTHPKLYGRQHVKADRVDLADQQGVYLLHGGRGDTVYVGQAKRLGARLSQHTSDRLAARWEFFSWFGIREVNEDGTMAEPSGVACPSSLVDTLEAVLIQSIEPRLNKQSGSKGGSEYIQAVDPRL